MVLCTAAIICHRECTKLLKLEAYRKVSLVARVWARHIAKTCMGVLNGAQKLPLSRVRRGCAPRSFSALLRFGDPPINVSDSRGCMLRYSFVPTPSCLDLGVILQVKSTSRLPKTSRVPCTFRPLVTKGGGVSWGCRVWLGGVTNGEKGVKIEVSGWKRFAEICTSIWRRSRDWILARFNGR